MKKYILSGSALGYILPMLAFAQGGGIVDGGGTNSDLAKAFEGIIEFANEILIPFIIGIGFLLFVFGMFQYFIAGGANDESREKGKKLMINATIAFVVIIIFFGVINVLTNSTGLQGQQIENVPEIPVPGEGSNNRDSLDEEVVEVEVPISE